MTSTIGVKKIQHTNGTQVMTFDTNGSADDVGMVSSVVHGDLA